MGRWAQGKRRGGGGTLVPTVGPPPQPLLYVQDLEVVAESTSTTDVLGYIDLELSADGNPPWNVEVSSGWARTVSFGLADQWEGLHARAVERGNGVDYAGPSAPSAVLHL